MHTLTPRAQGFSRGRPRSRRSTTAGARLLPAAEHRSSAPRQPRQRQSRSARDIFRHFRAVTAIAYFFPRRGPPRLKRWLTRSVSRQIWGRSRLRSAIPVPDWGSLLIDARTSSCRVDFDRSPLHRLPRDVPVEASPSGVHLSCCGPHSGGLSVGRPGGREFERIQRRCPIVVGLPGSTM